MTWQTPKTNWQAADVVSKDDFNRIEGNIQELQDTKETPAGAQAKANTAEANAKAYTNAHEQKAAPHSGHETPAGAQAKATAAAGAVQAQLNAHLAETTQNAHLAKNIGIEDAAGNFTVTDVEGALNELFTNVSNGKNLIASAITGKGVSASGSDTFAQLANKINSIQTFKYASGTFTESASIPERYVWNVTGLVFTPRVVIVKYREYDYSLDCVTFGATGLIMFNGWVRNPPGWIGEGKGGGVSNFQYGSFEIHAPARTMDAGTLTWYAWGK